MKHGRPTKRDRSKIEKMLQSHYQKGISASATSRVTKLNIKTVLKYFKKWDKEIFEFSEKEAS